ncbi:MAG TPA: hypothetical protein VJ773_04250, partial [Gemmatimonadales bacterium]|nr:hypothetical protein [Gemmatimonadales bacterium]
MTRSWMVLGALTGVLLLPEASPPSPTLAFASKRDGNWEIYTVRVPGGPPVRLTTRAPHDRFPLWSPDGTRLAFGSQARSDSWDPWELWVMNADGSGARFLATGIIAKAPRDWSPDGRALVIEAERAG